MDIEYTEPTELDLKLEKMALFMDCSRKVVKYQEEVWNSSNESYWNWLNPVIKKVYDIVSFQMDFELHLEQTLEALKWHTFMGDIKEAFNICNGLINKINNK